jgi:vacuolar-type H+-ATPase subunit H
VSADDPQARSRPLVPSAGEHIRAVVEAAERAAESIVDEAEAQAQRYLVGAQAEAERAAAERLASLSEQIEALLDQAESIRDGAERLAASLEEARGGLDSGPAEPAPRGSHLTAVASVGSEDGELAPLHLEPAGDGDGDGSERAGDAGARLLATQMAVSGSSREEIRHRLRNGFEIADTGAILDAILGPED